MTDPLQAAAGTVIDETLAAMRTIVADLGDDLANVTPPLPQTNSPYAIVFHCVELTKFWAGSVIGGEQIPRDRDAEFHATGTVADLCDALDDLRARVGDWLHIAVTEGVRDREVRGSTRTADIAEATPQWIVLHVVRELAQHLGQLELTRDVLCAEPPTREIRE
ncbi:DinB family protein [Williamsia sp. MIQD14]|uniref:DinB family protein n=1 Tax=Williamsia sp. MIQD14 TaxID=3425703 RepID=UPI003DA107F8